MTSYQFTNNWFGSVAKGVWDQLMPQLAPARILEIGSYEGASACYLIDALAPRHSLELHCIDTWEGGVEHQIDGNAPADMHSVERRFHHNVALAAGKYPGRARVEVHKGFSDDHLAALIAAGKKSYFDFVYVDGSHQAADVLVDAVLGFKLLRVGGVIAFDDYLWSEALPSGKDPLRCPKPAIDAFVNLNFRKVEVLSAPLYQLYVRKLSD
jgi:predicted O-methyltransferase YrrM